MSRKVNFKKAEMALLLRLAEPRKEQIETPGGNKPKDNAAKTAVWNEIASEFNAQMGAQDKPPKTGNECRASYLTFHARKRLKMRKNHSFRSDLSNTATSLEGQDHTYSFDFGPHTYAEGIEMGPEEDPDPLEAMETGALLPQMPLQMSSDAPAAAPNQSQPLLVVVGTGALPQSPATDGASDAKDGTETVSGLKAALAIARSENSGLRNQIKAQESSWKAKLSQMEAKYKGTITALRTEETKLRKQLQQMHAKSAQALNPVDMIKESELLEKGKADILRLRQENSTLRQMKTVSDTAKDADKDPSSTAALLERAQEVLQKSKEEILLLREELKIKSISEALKFKSLAEDAERKMVQMEKDMMTARIEHQLAPSTPKTTTTRMPSEQAKGALTRGFLASLEREEKAAKVVTRKKMESDKPSEEQPIPTSSSVFWQD